MYWTCFKSSSLIGCRHTFIIEASSSPVRQDRFHGVNFASTPLNEIFDNLAVNALVLLYPRRGMQSAIQLGELLRFTGDGRATDASIFDLYNSSFNIKKPSVMSTFELVYVPCLQPVFSHNATTFGRIRNRSAMNQKHTPDC